MARPRLMVDYAIVLRMRDIDQLGWSRMAEEYRKVSGQFISRDTIKRRYYMAKLLQTYDPAIYSGILLLKASTATAKIPPGATHTSVKIVTTIQVKRGIYIKRLSTTPKESPPTGSQSISK